MGTIAICIAIGFGFYLALVAIDELREDLLGVLDNDAVPREVHNQRVLELLNANNRDLEKRRRLAAAAHALRQTQRVYLAARGNMTPEHEREALGSNVAAAAAALDKVLEEVAR